MVRASIVVCDVNLFGIRLKKMCEVVVEINNVKSLLEDDFVKMKYLCEDKKGNMCGKCVRVLLKSSKYE